MRVANPEAIRRGEKALAEAIASNFDSNVIQKIFKRVHNLDVGEDIKCKNASMGVHGEKVAYSMNFEVLVNLSVFLDRSGNFISITSSGVAPESSPMTEKPVVETSEKPVVETSEKPVVETSEKPVVETSEKPHAGEMAGAEPPPDVKTPAGEPSSEGSYESVLREFLPIESEQALK
jgi:hypothetical protein